MTPIITLVLLTLVLISPALSQTAPPIPLLAQWEEQMVVDAFEHARDFNDPSATFDEKLGATYYDSAWVFYQIADYAGAKGAAEFAPGRPWAALAVQARRQADRMAIFFRDKYVRPSRGRVPGYWNFPQGLTEHAKASNSSRSKAAVIQLSRNAAFAGDGTRPSMTAKAARSRETAYTIISYLEAEQLGAPRRERLSLLVDQALGHIDQWCIAGNAPFVKPFMVGLTAHALILYEERRGDERILPALTAAADCLWDHMWDLTSQSFLYIDHPVARQGAPDPAPDLNNLIAPLYAWLWHRTGEARFLERGDQIFAGGVQVGYLGGSKQFNQNYYWSFDFVRWRSVPPLISG